MDRTHRHLRSLAVAMGLLALTAGLAVAHELPAAADHGLGTASEAAGKTVPVGNEGAGAPDAPGPQNAAPAAGEHAENHGSAVSDAAKAETPDGFDNHGQYVSSVAKGNAGKPEAAAGGQDKAAAAPGRTKSAEAKAKGNKGGEAPAD
jgi:hypothetical protein